MTINANGSAHYIRTANLPTGDFTICGWFRVNTWSGGQYQTFIQAKTDTFGAELAIGIDTSADQLFYFFYNGGSATDPLPDLIADDAYTGWIYCAISRTGTTVKARAIKSGGAVATAGTFPSTLGALTHIHLLYSPYGEQAEDIDAVHVRVFASELSDAELLAEAQSATAIVTPVAVWPLATPGDAIQDATANNYDLTATGTAVDETDVPSDLGGGGGPADPLVFSALTALAALPSTAVLATAPLTSPAPARAVSPLIPASLTASTPASSVASLTTAPLSAVGSARSVAALIGRVLVAASVAASVASLAVTPLVSPSVLPSAAPGLGTWDPATTIVVDGNSIPNGHSGGSHSPYSWGQGGLETALGITVINRSYDGATTPALVSRFSSTILPLLGPGVDVLFLELINHLWAEGANGAGTNPTPRQAVDAVWAYAALVRAAGSRFIVSTATPGGSGPFEPLVLAANALIRAEWTSHADAMFDAHAIPEFSPGGWPNDEFSADDDTHLANDPVKGYGRLTARFAAWYSATFNGIGPLAFSALTGLSPAPSVAAVSFAGLTASPASRSTAPLTFGGLSSPGVAPPVAPLAMKGLTAGPPGASVASLSASTLTALSAAPSVAVATMGGLTAVPVLRAVAPLAAAPLVPLPCAPSVASVALSPLAGLSVGQSEAVDGNLLTLSPLTALPAVPSVAWLTFAPLSSSPPAPSVATLATAWLTASPVGRSVAVLSFGELNAPACSPTVASVAIQPLTTAASLPSVAELTFAGLTAVDVGPSNSHAPIDNTFSVPPEELVRFGSRQRLRQIRFGGRQ